jgi:predicted AlkP superfamily phosphohydrolase/phosphomutase
MPKLIVIGIDGMDPWVFDKLHTEMPHLSSILQTGCYKHCDSVFPPDSIPAWATIFTGQYPDSHGWLDNIDYEDIRRGAAVNKMCDLQGRTFWDQLSNAGKRVCIINPLLAYPPWPVNGVMASGPVFITGEKQIYPEKMALEYKLPELGGMTDFPAENQLEQFLEEGLLSTRELAQFGLQLMDSEQWDLFFISFFALDRIQHFLWRFWDTSDPLYPGSSKLESAIVKAYKAFDDIIGTVLERTARGTGLIVLSDHGHGQRPTMLLNLNEALRIAGLLRVPGNIIRPMPLRKYVEIIKNMSIKITAKTLGERWLYRIGRMLPRNTRKALKKSSYLIDRESSTAWVSDIGGGASVGGITINGKIPRLSMEYKQAIEEVKKCLSAIPSGSYDKVVQWIKVPGNDSSYPDVIFEMDSHFSVGRSLFCPLVEESPRHKVISGGHKKQSVFFAHNCGLWASSIHSISDIPQNIVSFVLSQNPD